jgi:serine/threonine protein kinase
MELTVQNVYGLLLRSKLLSHEEARAMFARWHDDAKDQAADPARFAAWMVQHKYVTEYQATLLARGHADSFFLNDYKILDRLGKGRMAGVYRARHRLGQIVAIKVLPPSKARDPLLLGRFQREARLTLKLKHPNIVRAFQVGVCGDLHYLVMEHLEGTTLEEVLHRRDRLSPPEAARLIHQALGGLQHIHEQGLVHRDLKPANLMLIPPPGEGSTLGCTVKILDIGLGRALFEEGMMHEPPDPNLTGEGVLLGTPDYMAPEQARDARATSIRADIYSLGCVLYHLIAGQPPFPDTNIISQMIRHASEVPRPLRDFNPAVPHGLQQIINWMLAKDPAARYATPERAAQALEVFLAAGAPPSSPELDPSMASFLSWLDDEGKKEPDGPASPDLPSTEILATLPAKPSSGAVPVVAAKPLPPKAPSAKDKPPRKGKKKRRPAAPASAAGAAPLVDPGLITVPSAVARRKAAAPGGLTRRDFVMFLAGVGSGLLAYAIGRGVAILLGRPRPKDPD